MFRGTRSPKVLLCLVITLVIGLAVGELVWNVSQGAPWWKVAGLSKRMRIHLTGERLACIQPLSDILKRRGIRKPRHLSVEIDKSERLLRLKMNGSLLKTYVVALGYDPVSRKTQYGDNSTPEGAYYICEKNPRSAYYLSLKLSYPNMEDARSGYQAGLIDDETCRRIARAIRRERTPPMDTKLGGNICIHGGGVGSIMKTGEPSFIEVIDWTLGCVALANTDMKELYDLLPVGTRVRIIP